ncbi:Vegetative incompatibility protein HET-E-1 [Colletotrichum siamense]|nr:Vegetative incompatibility protein HET-E-1 [Colletotrichum siamense]
MPRQRLSWDVSKGSSDHLRTPSDSVETLCGDKNIENDCVQTDLQGAINFWISEAGKLEPERRALFLRVSNATSYEGYVTDLAKTIKDTSNLSKVSRISRKLKPIYQLSNSIAPIVTSASQFTPMPASLVLGGITCILSLSTRVDDFQSKLLETLEWMADEVDLINDYRHERIFDGDVAVEACEINLAADILKFCIEVTKLFYDDSGRQKSSLIFALKGLCKDFDVRFGDIKTDFKLHLTSLEKRRDLVNARKLRSVHVGLYDIGKILKREHEDRGRVDRAESRVGWHQEERRRRFLDWLPTLDFGEIQENNFERRAPGSGDWLLDHEDFQMWKASPVSTLLWIHGKPGSGKSHLAARVIHDLSPSPSQTDKTAVAFAYCTTTQTKTRMTMNNVLGTILGQLYKQLPITESIETLLSRSDNSAKEDPQRSEMKEGIRTVVCRLRSSYIVIDGLDECSHFPDHQFEDLCNFIASLAEIKDAGVSARILVLSRPEYKDVESAFSIYPQIQMGNGVNDGDIKAYISQKVDGINTSPSSEERVEFETIKTLMFNNSGGLFLWVHFKAKHFKEIGCVEDIKDALNDRKEGLDDLYGEEIGKIMSHPSRFVRDRALRALLWVTNSYRSLSKAELLEALSIKPGRMGINQSQRLPQGISISTECADLINEINGVYQLRHASLKDFLSSQLPTLLSYGALQQQAHTIMAETCLTYISFEDFNTFLVQSPQQLSGLKTRYPLLDYATCFWGHHFLQKDEARAEDLNALLGRFLTKEAAIRLSIQILESRAFQDGFWNMRKPTALHILAIFDLAEVAAKMPAIKSHLTSRDDFSHVPLEYAVLYRHRKTTRWLLDEHLRDFKHDHHRSIDILQSCKAWLLHSVAEENWDDIVEDLVSMGFDVNARDLSGESPVHAAVRTSANI